ncbi:MAG TPA: translation initiation factor IF-2, partial [Phycisphaerales bacterium]|nr:translation initiation factor IF-2 [Phycisphaerales bacterium]
MATATKVKIHQISKELNIDSKVIIAKLRAEEIPGADTMTSISSIPLGLAVTIKEWFSDPTQNHATAVENAAPVDKEKIKPAKKTTAKKKVDADGTEAKSDDEAKPAADAPATTKVEAKADSKPEAPAAQAKTDSKPQSVTEAKSAPQPAAQSEAKPEAKADSKPEAPKPDAKPLHKPIPRSIFTSEPRTPAATPAPLPVSPTNISKATVIQPSAPEPAPAPKPVPTKPAEARPAASTTPNTPGQQGPGGTPSAPPRNVAPSRPPLMNVPMRPTTVGPAGPKLEIKTPVKLSGPKIVRVEAPENIAPPRPRGPRPPMGGGGGMSRPGEDDRGRSPRRKDAPGAGAAGKRSSGAGVPDRRRGLSTPGEWSPGPGFSEQDMIEREARLARAGGFLKKRKQELNRPGQVDTGPAEGKLKITAPFTIKDLSEATGVKASEIVKKLFMQGIMRKINDPLEVPKAVEIMMDFDIDLEVTEARTAEETVSDQFIKRDNKDLRQRGAVVTILGHVDHGKTSLLDRIRNANVAAGEAGGITQKTSAFVAEVSDAEGGKKQVVFLDTPGHEAFTGMRARGAKLTDVVVLVVSAPEGVMPQTVESINHAKAAGVPIVVALNKIDRPDATESQIQKTLGQLAAAGLNVVEWGGDTEMVRVSAQTGQGIPELLNILDLQSSVLELKADFEGPAQGTVIEAKVEEGRGAVANMLVQQGRLKVGDFIVMGRAFGRVRDITDDKGKRIKEALPPMPVQISGINEVCDAGDKFYVTPSLKQAEEAAEQRRDRERHTALAAPKLTLDTLFSQMQTAQATEPVAKEIRIILKTDQQGTVDVLKAECEKIKTEEVKVRVIDAAVGGITESNVILAEASKAIVIGFNVIPSGKARQLAEQKGVELRAYQVIYDITEDLRKAAEGLLAPEVREEVLGHAEVRAVFKVSKVGNIAGCYVTDG